MRTSLRFLVSLLATTATIAGCELEYAVDDGARPRWSHELDAGGDVAVGRANDAAPRGGGSSGTCAVIDRDKELLVIDRRVLESDEARNDVPGAAFSFRSRMDEMAGSASASTDLTLAWLDTWATVTSVGGSQVGAPVIARPAVRDVLITPWRALAGAYGEPDARPSMAMVPFRLIAIANRLDLRGDDAGCTGDAGELRFVYTAVQPRTRGALAMTVIVEVPYPATLSARSWAEEWHALAKNSFDGGYVAGLASVVREVVRTADPNRARIRTDEIALGGSAAAPWELRQFERTLIGGAPRLVPSLLTTTPRDGLDGTPSLRSWLIANERSLEAGGLQLPAALQAGATTLDDAFASWGRTTPISEKARQTFSMGTCSGCHGGERAGDSLQFQHLAPWDAPTEYYGSVSQSGDTRVSDWLKGDELTRREKALLRLLCASPCSKPTPTPSTPPMTTDGGTGYGASSCR